MTEPAHKSRSGSYVPEVDRGSEQVKLRLRPIDRVHLDALARRWGLSRSEAVARMVEEATEWPFSFPGPARQKAGD